MPPSKLYTADHNLAEYGIPYRGLWLQTPTYQSPPDSLRAAKNVLVRNGILTHRPGYTRHTGETFADTPTGAFPYVSIGDERAPIMGSLSSFYQFNGSAWQDVTGSAAVRTSTNLQLVRFTSIVLGADTPTNPLQVYVFASDGVNTPQWKAGVGGYFEPTGKVHGDPDTFPDTDPELILYFTDLCTIADKVVGIVPPYLVGWSTTLMNPNIGHFSFQDSLNWPALNRHQEASTPDRVVAIRNLSSVSGCLYKQQSMWAISTTGAQSEAAAFRFDLIGMYDGPAGPAAVINCNGSQMRMTLNGRLGFFNGGSHRWVGDGAWPYIRSDLNVGTAKRVHGWYDPLHDECWFVYPSVANSNKMTGLVIITFPKPDWGIEDFGVFVGQLAHEVTASTVDRSPTEVNRILLFGDETLKRPYLMDAETTAHATDDSVAITGHWQTPMSSNPGREPIRLESVETFASRGTGYGQLDLQAVSSYTLADEGKLSSVIPVNLELPDEPVRADIGADVRGRFIGLRYAFDATQDIVQYKGAVTKAQKAVL